MIRAGRAAGHPHRGGPELAGARPGRRARLAGGLDGARRRRPRPCAWWLDAQVDKEYFNPDPVAHAREIAAGLGLPPDAGCAMLTAADVRRWAARDDEGVDVAATVGLGLPVLAAVPPEVGGAGRPTSRSARSTCSSSCPSPLSDAALVNAVVTATEAKVQALAEAGRAGQRAPPRTPSASRAPSPAGADLEPYGGPRSPWGARHRARRARGRGGRHRRLVRGEQR